MESLLFLDMGEGTDLHDAFVTVLAAESSLGLVLPQLYVPDDD